jgi:thiosulfate/3-mercaptopyruvate sulfurtransferase
MRTRFFLAIFTVGLCLCQQGPDPWPGSALLDPAALAEVLKSAAAKHPHVICVAFPVLYRAKHISYSSFAGPGSKAEGLEALKKAVAKLDKNSDIVLYCGCCPMDHCPNLRPAFRVLAEMGFRRVRVLNIPNNMPADWSDKGYPTEVSAEGSK